MAQFKFDNTGELVSPKISELKYKIGDHVVCECPPRYKGKIDAILNDLGTQPLYIIIVDNTTSVVVCAAEDEIKLVKE